MDNVSKIIQTNFERLSRANYLNSIGNISYDLRLNSIIESASQMSKIFNGYNSSFDALNKSLISTIDQYRRSISNATWGGNPMDALTQPVSSMSVALQHMSTGLEHLPAFSVLQTRIFEQPDLMSYLHEAIDSQIDTSLWDYFDSLEDDLEVTIDNAIVEEILEISKSSDIKEQFKTFIAEKGKVGLEVLKRIFLALLSTFLIGLFNHCCEPIYQSIEYFILRPIESVENAKPKEIPPNTELHLWGDLENDFIEITGQLDGEEFYGYISKADLETKSKKISGEVTLEHLLFINHLTKLFSEHWDLDPDVVYLFFNQETNLVNSYILEHYEVLKEMDDEKLISVVEVHCKESEITIPKLREE